MPESTQGVDTYTLKRDYAAGTRLTAQFILWKENLQYNLHPSIPITDNGAVADVATGNGIWLIDMARTLPSSVQLHGFDISLDQCPPTSWLPRNVSMHTWNIFNDPPEAFIGVFDVVHIRLITLVIKDNDPCQIISNMHKLLTEEPGGYLQWDEVDTLGSYIKTTSPCITTNALESIRQRMSSPGNSRGLDNWKLSLPETLNQQGFQDSRLYRHEIDTTMARYWSDVYMSTWDEFARTVLKNPDETSKTGAEAMEEVRHGSALLFPKLVWVARKIS